MTEPIAVVQGEPRFECPKDLYIPPDALEVFLETFEGPLDLLLYLIRQQNLDILDIPIAAVTSQYMQYINLMQAMRLELVAEYLLMAAMLAQIKSRLLLPQPSYAEDEEGLDPRAELVRRLQEYERYQQAAKDLEALPRLGRDLHAVQITLAEQQLEKVLPQVCLDELVQALQETLKRSNLFTRHQIEREPLSVRERMSQILSALGPDQFMGFSQLFDCTEGRPGAVVTFMAILELLRQQLIEFVQTENFSQLHLKICA